MTATAHLTPIDLLRLAARIFQAEREYREIGEYAAVALAAQGRELLAEAIDRLARAEEHDQHAARRASRTAQNQAQHIGEM
jgi:hypothetical protein